MSRIGNQELLIPAKVDYKNENNVITIKGPKGEMTRAFNTNFEIKEEAGKIKVINNSEDKKMRALHGTTTALIKNMLTGVSDGFKKELELNGVGYRAAVKGKVLNLQVGLSHEVNLDIPADLTVEAPSNTELIVSGFDKQSVGEFSANIRKIRKPEPYKGKGIKYKDEVIIRKEGKRAGS